MINKLLIANRGEIACRIIRTCKRLGIRTVAVYSEADQDALHRKLADEAICVGAARPADSYLNGQSILNAASQTGADAIHPGYGFLSENARFARDVEQAGLIWVGPTAATIEQVGSKAAAKTTMTDAGVPQLPGYHGDDQSESRLVSEAARIGFPLMIKAEAGGGGKGMRIVEDESSFSAQLATTRREAANAFGDDRVLLEKYLPRPRHLEVQVISDSHGNCIHLFERECSSQRRFQKVIEESPAVNLDDDIRQRLWQAGIDAARAVNYINAGTVEFIADENGEFYFMEINARLQVEHPVTEMVTGLDLVEWQLRIASGEPLPASQEQISSSGHAIEARLYAEDSDQDLLPSSGTITGLNWPEDARIDTGVVDGDEISVHYDPMIAKLVVYGRNRESALARLDRAIAQTSISGLKNNLRFLYRLIRQDIFREGRISTSWIDRHLDRLTNPSADLETDTWIGAALAACLGLSAELDAGSHNSNDTGSPWSLADSWQLSGRRSNLFRLMVNDSSVEARLCGHDGTYEISLDGETASVTSASLIADSDGLNQQVNWIQDGAARQIALQRHGSHYRIQTADDLVDCLIVSPDQSLEGEQDEGDRISAPMPGQIISIVQPAGSVVEKNQPVLIMEAMKMELTLVAPMDGTIKAIHVKENSFVEADALLAELEGTSDENE